MSHVKISTNTSFHPVSLPSWCETSTKATSMRHNHYFCGLKPYWREETRRAGLPPLLIRVLAKCSSPSPSRNNNLPKNTWESQERMWDLKIKRDQTNTHWSMPMVILKLKLKELKTFSPTFSGEMGHLHFGHMAMISQRKGRGQAEDTWVRHWAHDVLPGHVSPWEKWKQEAGRRAQEVFGKFHLTVKTSTWMKPWACFASSNVPFKVWLNFWGLIQSSLKTMRVFPLTWAAFGWGPWSWSSKPDSHEKGCTKRIRSRNPCRDGTQSCPRWVFQAKAMTPI